MKAYRISYLPVPIVPQVVEWVFRCNTDEELHSFLKVNFSCDCSYCASCVNWFDSVNSSEFNIEEITEEE